jgi:hypothetical protein
VDKHSTEEDCQLLIVADRYTAAAWYRFSALGTNRSGLFKSLSDLWADGSQNWYRLAAFISKRMKKQFDDWRMAGQAHAGEI